MAVCTAQVEAMLNEGIFDMQKYVDGSWVTGLRYEDEVMDDLKKRTGGKADKLRSVSTASDLAHPEHVCQKLHAEMALRKSAWVLCSLQKLDNQFVCLLMSEQEGCIVGAIVKFPYLF